jgi:glycosyltransferase family protein
MPKISVVVPVYNVEKYLKECLDSILNQSYKDFEVVCVNDGSTDNSLEILNEYAKKDLRINVINQENQGSGLTRNDGLSLVKGDYIIFVDADDYLEEGLFESLVKSFCENPDIAIFGAKTFNCKRNKIYKGQYSSKKFKKDFSVNNLFQYHTVCWNKAYRNLFLKENNLIFEDIKTGEEQAFCIKCYLLAKSVKIIKKDFYVYRKYRNGSLTTSKRKKDISPIQNTYLIEKFLSEHKVDAKLKDKILTKYILKCFSWYGKTDKTYLKIFYSELENLFKYLQTKEEGFWWKYYTLKSYDIDKKCASILMKLNIFKAIIFRKFFENKIIKNIVSKDAEHLHIRLLGLRFKIRINKISAKKIIKLNQKYEIKSTDKNVIFPKVKNTNETLETLLNSNLSICRYGDGEFNLIFGNNLSFQKYSDRLAEKLKNILKSTNSNIMVGIPDRFANLDMCTEDEASYWRKYFVYNREKIYSILDMQKIYYDTEVSRPYMGLKDKSNCRAYFERMKQLWANKDVVFVEGEATRLGYHNDLFSNTQSVKRIICPAKHAFDKYDEILNACKNLSKDKLFIIALGPTATVLAYDLAEIGYRALDVGHVDIEYEWFLRGVTKKIPIKDKYVNEAKKTNNISKINDSAYNSEIIVDLTQSEEK